MPQLSLYLDDATMDTLKEKATEAHVSLSKYVTHLIKADGADKGWPAGYWENVYGSLTDPTFVAPHDELPLDDICLY